MELIKLAQIYQREKYGAFNTGSGTGFATLYSDSTKSDTVNGGGWSN